jgi:hypothetical protein
LPYNNKLRSRNLKTDIWFACVKEQLKKLE